MPRYLDTGAGAPDDCLGSWLERELVIGIREFRAQLGYYSFGALEPFVDAIKSAGQSNAPIRLVVGSNQGSLTQVDLARTWALFDGLPDGKLTVIAYSNALFHPKVVHVVSQDRSTTAIVGSGNLTDRGLAWNVEASVSLDTRDGDPQAVLDRIAGAIDRWHSADVDGVYLISSADDVRRLTATELIDLPQPEPPRVPEATAARRALRAGRRPRLWRPPVPVATPTSVPPARPAPPAAPALVAVGPATALPYLRWCKQLPESDAQQVAAGSNPTGKLRLTESRHAIDHRTFFRHQLFRTAVWTAEVRAAGLTYEEAQVDFDVTIHGRHLGVHTLAIDHAQHREAGQGNVVTVLAWGPVLGRELRRRSYAGNWVVIEQRPDGTFALRIDTHKPLWAP